MSKTITRGKRSGNCDYAYVVIVRVPPEGVFGTMKATSNGVDLDVEILHLPDKLFDTVMKHSQRKQ